MVQHERTGFPFLIDGGEGNDPLDIPEDPP
jgi:hypothetical protein